MLESNHEERNSRDKLNLVVPGDMI